MDFKIKEVRAEYKLSQQELSDLTEIPKRTIENWESGKRSPSPWVKKMLIVNLKNRPHNEYGIITNKKGYYTVNQIRDLLLPLTYEYDIDKFIVFGSYSRGEQDEDSDIDLVVDGDVGGLDFFGLLEDVTNRFVKSIDLIHLSQIEKDSPTYQEVMKGIVLYDKKGIESRLNGSYITLK